MNLQENKIKSYEVVSVSLEDLQELGFNTSKVTNSDLQYIARKMDLSEMYWDKLECIAKAIGLKKIIFDNSE